MLIFHSYGSLPESHDIFLIYLLNMVMFQFANCKRLPKPKVLKTTMFQKPFAEVMFHSKHGDLLLGGFATPLKNMTSSVGIMTFPIYIYGKKMFQTTNQSYTGWFIRIPPSWIIIIPSILGSIILELIINQPGF